MYDAVNKSEIIFISIFYLIFCDFLKPAHQEDFAKIIKIAGFF